MSEPNKVATKKLSQVYVEHQDGTTNELVPIILPLEQVILPKSDNNEEENLSLLVWKVID